MNNLKAEPDPKLRAVRSLSEPDFLLFEQQRRPSARLTQIKYDLFHCGRGFGLFMQMPIHELGVVRTFCLYQE